MTIINITPRRPPSPVPLTIAEIIALVPNAVCSHCWARHLAPCKLPPGVPPGSFHAGRLTRLTRSGVISFQDAARVLESRGNPRAMPAAIISPRGAS